MSLAAGFIDRPIAHRALHGRGRAENSLSAIKAAIAHGYGVELDLQPALGGTPMVFHDAELTRLTGRPGKIRDTAEEELRQASLKGTGEWIPSLRETLDLVAGRVPILLEIKDQDGQLGPTPGLFEQAIAREIADYKGDLAVMAFNAHSIAHMQRLIPKLARGLVTCDYSAPYWDHLPTERRESLGRIADFARLGASFISHQHLDLQAQWPSELRKAGVPVLSWTITSPAQEVAARAHCNNITFEQYLPEL